MSRATKTLDKVLRGNADANIRFGDLCSMLSHYGFIERIKGDHHIFTHEQLAEILNLQPKNGKAKPYQVKQIRNLLASSRLIVRPHLQDEDEESNDEQ